MAEDEYPVFTPLGAATVVDDTRTWVSPGGYTLSGRLWRARSIDAKSMDFVLYTGISKGLGALETAKHLEAFLTPEGLSSKTRHPTGRGSGNAAARRLARTETSRSFAVAQLKTDEASPFVEGSHWNRSSAHKDEDECDENATGHSPGMAPGDYVTSSFPRIPSHPHCMCYPTSVVPKDTEAVVRELAAQIHPPAQSFPVLDTPQARLEAAATRAFAEGRISQSTAKQHIANGLKGKYDEAHIRATTDYLNIKVDPFRALEHGIQLAEREGTITSFQAAELRGRTMGEKEITETLKRLRGEVATTTRAEVVKVEAAASTRPAWLKPVDDMQDVYARRAGLGRGGSLSEAQLRKAGAALREQLLAKGAAKAATDPTMSVSALKRLLAKREQQLAEHPGSAIYRNLRDQALQQLRDAESIEESAIEQMVSLLSEVREVGSPLTHQFTQGSAKAAKAAIDGLSKILPKDWIERSTGFNRLRSKVVQRAYYKSTEFLNGPTYEAISALHVSGTKDLANVAMHEFGHRMEHINPDMLAASQEFLARRAAGEKLSTIYKGTGEKGWKDKFGDHYMGKKYDNATEILSMGLQDLYGQRRWLLADHDYMDFILGMLAVY